MGRFENAPRAARDRVSAAWQKLPENLREVPLGLCGIALYFISGLIFGPVVIILPVSVAAAAWNFMGPYGLILLAVLIVALVASIGWIAERFRRSERLPSNEHARR